MRLDDQDSLSLSDDEDSLDVMSRRERICAIALGALAGGAGGYAVFASSNQVGTAVLLLISAVFLLVGIQGTPLVRFTSSSASVELSRRRRVNKALQRAKEERNPERAAGIVEGVSIAEPNLVPRSYVTGVRYEKAVATALIDLGYVVTDQVHDIGYGLAVEKGGKRVGVNVKYYHAVIQGTTIKPAIQAAEQLALPILIVANQEMTAEAAKELAGHTNLRFALWRDEQDNNELKRALIGLGICSP
jgi:hypothetical protein